MRFFHTLSSGVPAMLLVPDIDAILGKVAFYNKVISSNLVTFFVKISEIAMTKLTCIHFLLVESQIFHIDIGST